MANAQKFTIVHDGKTVLITGTFKNGKPKGQVFITIDGGEALLVESPFDDSADEPVASEEVKAQPTVEEEKKQDADDTTQNDKEQPNQVAAATSVPSIA